MSLLDQASLVLVPSAIKTGEVLVQKPLPTKFSDETGNYDGNDPTTNANLTFTRNSNATRVNADGLVEKVRTNLLLQSNQFDTTWGNSNSTETGGQADKDGGTTAWKIDKTAANGYIVQSISTSGVQTFSTYAKAGTTDWLQLLTLGSGTGSAYVFFDLTNGTIGIQGGSGTYRIGSKIESVGGGWYRCSLAINTTLADVRIYPAEANTTSATSGNIIVQSAQLETGDIATDYIATTTSARSTFAGITVDGTSVPNVPRLDYSGGATCGKLLLEPQRTNLALYSEQIDNAGGWQVSAATVAANQTTSPDGYQNADELTVISNGGGIFTSDIAVSSSTAYTFSFYAKQGTATQSYLAIRDQTNAAFIDIDIQYAATNTEWTRVTHTFTTPATCTSVRCYLQRKTNGGIGTHYFWGAQLEAGSYASSYIPTLGSAVTKLADAASRTNISNLIGQTEGTLFIDANLRQISDSVALRGVVELNDGTTNNRISIVRQDNSATLATLYGAVSGVPFMGIAFNTYERSKIAFSYNSTNVKLYVNGSLIATDTTVTIPALSDLDLGIITNNASRILGDSINEVLLFKTALTDAQLAELTTL